MRLLTKLVAGGGIAAFFFFSFIIQILWNSIVVGHLGLLRPLTYLQAAGLWFLVTLFLAWTGIGASGRLFLRWKRERDWDEFGRRVESRIKSGFARWVDSESDVEWEDLGQRMEEKIKRKFSEWTKED